MAVGLGLAAAVAYGVGDFLGGWLSRRVHYALVSVISYIVALALTVLALLLIGASAPEPAALLWGAASGVGGAVGTLALFRGLGHGRMGVVAPLSAVGAASLPVVIGVVLGDRPSPVAWSGVLLALPAIWLVSTPGHQETDATPAPNVGSASGLRARGVADGLLAGVGFALLFVALGLAGDGSGLWPVLAGQASAVVVLSIVTAGILRTIDWHLPAREVTGAAAVGTLGAAAVIFYFWSTHEGLLSIVAVLTSLYPAVTVVLAAALLHEAINRRQAVGLALAATAVLLIVLG